MAENKLKIQHLRSKELVDGKPKLPTELDEGEIAINFANGHETIAIKNDRNQIVKFDNKVDENYEQTHYTDCFDDLVDNNVVTNNDGDHLNTHIKGGDNIGFALKKTEGTINKLVEEIYDNEEITAKSIGTLGIATGVINDKGIIGYQKENVSNYIAGAHSVHEATVLLDSSLSRNENNIEILAESTGMKMDENRHAYEYTPEVTANYIGDAVSVHDATVKLDTALKQLCPINLDYVEINGVKWLTFDFNAFIGHTYHWGSLGDETQSPFPLRNPSDWNAIKNIVAPLSSNNEDEASVERTRLLSPSFDIIYHLTHGHARIAREAEYLKLITFANKLFSPGSPGIWYCNGVKFVAGIYKTAEVGALCQVNNKAGTMLSCLSSNGQEGRIMGVLIK